MASFEQILRTQVQSGMFEGFCLMLVRGVQGGKCQEPQLSILRNNAYAPIFGLPL